MASPDARALQVFDALADLPATERERELARLCAGDEALLAAVRRMLAADAGGDGVLGAPPDQFLDPDAGDAQDSLIGQTLGAWRLAGVLGHGGMGAVYRGERHAGGFEQHAAIKLIRMGMDSRQARERFLRERQNLARLRHPHIAALLDGGVSEAGAPWFAMELVEGQRIDHWCDARRLGIRARVQVFGQVLDALAYAHRNLVIHRDLKPVNVLVDGQGNAKLLDFGIARLLEEGTGDGLTATRERAMTPEYASPEQVHGQPVTTATDIYQLGLMLHGLLAGTHPFGITGQTPLAQQMQAMERTPQTLVEAAGRASNAMLEARATDRSGLARQVRGDLAAIVMHCLAREPERRYGSVDALASDLRAWLAGLPISVRADSRGYRLRRFLRRNRLAVAAVAAVVAALAIGLGGALWQAREARLQAQRAVAEQRRAQFNAQTAIAVRDTYSRLIRHGQMRGAMDVDDLVRMATASILADTQAPAAVRAEVLLDFLETHPDQDDPAIMQPLLGKAATLVDAAGVDALRVKLLRLQAYMAQSPQTAVAFYKQALEAVARLPAPLPLEMRKLEQDLLGSYAERLLMVGRPLDALPITRRRLALSNEVYGPAHARTATAGSHLANIEYSLGRQHESLRTRDAIDASFKPLVATDAITQLAGRARSLMMLPGRMIEAEAHLERAQTIAQGHAPSPLFTREDRLTLDATIAELRMRQGRYDAAAAALARDPPSDDGFPRDDERGVLAIASHHLAQADLARLRGDAGVQATQASRALQAGRRIDSANARILNTRASLLLAQATLARGGSAQAALRAVAQALETRRPLSQSLLTAAPATTVAAQAVLLAGKPRAAARLAAIAVEQARALPQPDPWQVAQAQLQLGLAQRASGDGQWRGSLQAADAAIVELGAPSHPLRATIADALRSP